MRENTDEQTRIFSRLRWGVCLLAVLASARLIAGASWPSSIEHALAEPVADPSVDGFSDRLGLDYVPSQRDDRVHQLALANTIDTHCGAVSLGLLESRAHVVETSGNGKATTFTVYDRRSGVLAKHAYANQLADVVPSIDMGSMYAGWFVLEQWLQASPIDSAESEQSVIHASSAA